MNFVNIKTLYKKDAKGKMRYWQIWQESINLIAIEYGTIGGEPLYDSEIINHGLAGRTQQEQIESRINSRYNKKVDSGYVDSKEKAELTRGLNAIGLQKPMLATNHDKIKNMKFEENYVQFKYDGHRCLIKNDGGELIAYSRNGKPIQSIVHILDELRELIPEGMTLDGELYHHGTPLQTIGSWVKKAQENTMKLKFICYDVLEELCYSDRNRIISVIFKHKLSHSMKAHTDLLIGEFNTAPLLKRARDLGYEGLIIRPTGTPYEAGKRSKSLIKVKSWFDNEYPVERITAGVDGQAILHMRHNGKPFKATCPGTFQEKVRVAESPEKHIGKKVNIQYANLTNDGVPFHPVATMWRDPDDE